MVCGLVDAGSWPSLTYGEQHADVCIDDERLTFSYGSAGRLPDRYQLGVVRFRSDLTGRFPVRHVVVACHHVDARFGRNDGKRVFKAPTIFRLTS